MRFSLKVDEPFLDPRLAFELRDPLRLLGDAPILGVLRLSPWLLSGQPGGAVLLLLCSPVRKLRGVNPLAPQQFAELTSLCAGISLRDDPRLLRGAKTTPLAAVMLARRDYLCLFAFWFRHWF